MAEHRKIPIGIEDFKEIINRNCYFADKTFMIKDILDSGAKVTLFTRPRRFGKILNMSMLRRFFEKTDNDNSHLFEGLNIADAGEKYLAHRGQYPVINMSLKRYEAFLDINVDDAAYSKAIGFLSICF